MRRPNLATRLCWMLSVVAATTVSAQQQQSAGQQQLRATRASGSPSIDGRADDPVWQGVPVSREFAVFRPTEGARPTFETEVKVAYDSRQLYVLVRAFDPHPDSIIGLLARRDNFGPPSDLIQLYVDSYHDGRSGYEYIVNPAGVKADMLLFDDSGFDLSWDGIWDVGTSVDSLGWVAEFAIPLAQLRFRGGDESSFGIMVWRTVGRLGERVSWPAYRPSLPGLVSQFAPLTGLNELPRRMRLEAAPYVLTRGRNTPAAVSSTETTMTGGMDLRFGPSPNVTIDATVNPDFGQVEADPAVLNLTAFETFLPERRPFFLEGAGLFKFTLSRDPNSNEGLFYTRRIGRRPSLADVYGGSDTPTETTILAAGKLTSRIGARTSLASLAAVTGEELGALAPSGSRYVVEPRTGYAVSRLQRDFREGRSGLGFMLTGVQRDLDATAAAFLPRRAVTGGVATQHLSRDGQYYLRGWASASDVSGDPAAIARVQLSPIHAYQRPDDHNTFDSTRTSLAGAGGQLFLGKTGGMLRYGTSLRYFSPGFDPSDLGFINEANQTSWTVDGGLQSTRASSWYRSAGISLIQIIWWSGPGKIEHQYSLNANLEFPSQWRLFANGAVQQLANTICSQKCTRGGPAIRKSPLVWTNLALGGDVRRSLIPEISVYAQRDDEGRSRTVRVVPGALWRAASNLQVSASVVIEEVTNDAQFYARFGSPLSDTTHYTIAKLVGGTRALTTRISYAATPSLSVEWYAQPFLAQGTYSNVRELNDPRADAYDQRFRPYADPAVTSAPGGVDFRQFRSNLVTRWEYRPGSVLFLVWSQGRDLFANQPATLNVGEDVRDLFALPPRNTIAIKASYWFGR
jgi:hypothetical protein